MFSELFPVARCLRGVTVTVPRAVRAGHSVTLGCDYDLENQALYSVKWYRGSDEFYRYVPKEEPPTRVFPLPGLKVDVSNTRIIIFNSSFFTTLRFCQRN